MNTLNLPVLTGRRERAVVKNPAPGTWRVKLTHTLIGTPQSFTGTLETTRAEYPPLTDIGGLTDVAKAEVYQNLRSFVMATSGNNFRPQFTISRYDLASALMVGGRVPQYMAGQPRFTDATDQGDEEHRRERPIGAGRSVVHRRVAWRAFPSRRPRHAAHGGDRAGARSRIALPGRISGRNLAAGE